MSVGPKERPSPAPSSDTETRSRKAALGMQGRTPNSAFSPGVTRPLGNPALRAKPPAAAVGAKPSALTHAAGSTSGARGPGGPSQPDPCSRSRRPWPLSPPPRPRPSPRGCPRALRLAPSSLGRLT